MRTEVENGLAEVRRTVFVLFLFAVLSTLVSNLFLVRGSMLLAQLGFGMGLLALLGVLIVDNRGQFAHGYGLLAGTMGTLVFLTPLYVRKLFGVELHGQLLIVLFGDALLLVWLIGSVRRNAQRVFVWMIGCLRSDAKPSTCSDAPQARHGGRPDRLPK